MAILYNISWLVEMTPLVIQICAFIFRSILQKIGRLPVPSFQNWGTDSEIVGKEVFAYIYLSVVSCFQSRSVMNVEKNISKIVRWIGR